MVRSLILLALLVVSVSIGVHASPNGVRGRLFDGDALRPVHHSSRPGAQAPTVGISVWDFVEVNRTILCEQLPTPLPVVAPVGICYQNPWPQYFGAPSMGNPTYGNWTTLYIDAPTEEDPTPKIYFYMWSDAECTQLVFGGAQASNSLCSGNVNMVAPVSGPYGPTPPAYPPQGWVAQDEYNDVFKCNSSSFSTSTLTPQGSCEQDIDGTWSAMYCDSEGLNVTTVTYLNSSSPNCASEGDIISIEVTPFGCSTGNFLRCPTPGGPAPPTPPTIEGPTFNQMVAYVAEDVRDEPSSYADRSIARGSFSEWLEDAAGKCGVQVLEWFSAPLDLCAFTGFGQSAQSQIYTCDQKNNVATVSTWLTQFDCSGAPDQVQNVTLGECLGDNVFYVAIATCSQE